MIGSGQPGMPWLRMHRDHCRITLMTCSVPLDCAPLTCEPPDCWPAEPPPPHAAAPAAMHTLITVSAIIRRIEPPYFPRWLNLPAHRPAGHPTAAGTCSPTSREP